MLEETVAPKPQHGRRAHTAQDKIGVEPNKLEAKLERSKLTRSWLSKAIDIRLKNSQKRKELGPVQDETNIAPEWPSLSIQATNLADPTRSTLMLARQRYKTITYFMIISNDLCG
ncbi:Uncharacterized protein Fot_54664 [Forsythia ovata]|uniref:Uncharacterized protein n=1 Tax=Forsythia ovata TaxID=205694 RepID=A0ABD1P6C1_9LAMI